jgi:hypothetical protein
VQTWLAGVLYQKQFATALLERKAHVQPPDSVERVDRLLGAAGAFENCVAFVQEAIAINVAVAKGGPVNQQYYRDLVRREVERISNTIRSRQFSGFLSDFWKNQATNLRRPMLSLRDVDEPGQIVGSRHGTDSREVSLEQIAVAMALIRNRGAGRRRHTTTSETDVETSE